MRSKKYIIYVLLILLIVSCADAQKSFMLTEKEKEYILNHDFKCVSTGTWGPFNILKNGKLTGISVDYWRLIRQKLHLKTSCKVVGTFTEVLNDIKNAKADLTFSTEKTVAKEKYALFSKPYLTFPIAIATKNSIGFIYDLFLLKGKKIAVGKNYTAEDLLKRYYPDIGIVEVENTSEALAMVQKGKAFGAIDVLPVLSYNINQHSFSNLKISGYTPWKFNIRIMVRKEHKKLIPLLNKTIDSIDRNEKEMIYLKWLRINDKSSSDRKIIAVLLLILILVTSWAVMLYKEVRKRELLEEELEYLATIDKLTSIYNRYKLDISFQEQIEIAKRYARPLSIIFFDIDFFKKINDTYGHKIGDDVLKELTAVVSNSLRKSDVFGRWGGEEFLIILPETSKEEAVKLAEKLRYIIEHHDFKNIGRLTCSFGVASFKKNDTTDTIMKRIDSRLYLAKKSGRNKVISD